MARYRQSKQRTLILNFLQATREHPTAAMVFHRVRGQWPRLSLGTVYRNLNILTDQGQIQRLGGEGRLSRYDACLQAHGHFTCLRCGAVHDIFLGREDVQRLTRDWPGRHLARDLRLEYRGTCARCRTESPHFSGGGKNELKRKRHKNRA